MVSNAPRRRPARFQPHGMRMLLAWLAAAMAVAAAVAALVTVAPGGTAEAAVFRLAQYRLWRILIVGLTAIGIILVPIIWATYTRLRDRLAELPKPVTEVPDQTRAIRVQPLWLSYIVLLVAVSAGQYLTASQGPLAHWPLRATALVALGMAIVAPAVVAIWLVSFILRRLRGIISALEPPEDGKVSWGAQQAAVLEWLRWLPTLLQRLLATLSAVISAVTLSTGALRLAVLQTHPKPQWPPSDPLLYGAFFAVLLAFSYLPAAVGLQEARNELANAVSPIPHKELTKEWYEDRERIDKLLSAEDGSKEAVQATIAILAPFLASLATVLLPAN